MVITGSRILTLGIIRLIIKQEWYIIFALNQIEVKTMAIVFFFACFISGCSDKKEKGFIIVDIGLEMSVKNTEGIDLLDPNSPGSFIAEDIKLFYLKNGEAEYVNEGHLDDPKGFRILRAEGEYRIRIVLNNSETEDFPITYIQWNEDRTDTIKCEIHREPGLVMCTKVWINDELKWEGYDTERFVEVIMP